MPAPPTLRGNMKQGCSFFDELPKRMQGNIDLWEALHEEMTTAAKALIPQGEEGKADESHEALLARRALNRLEGQKTTHVYEMRKIIEAYNKELDLAEADAMLDKPSNSPELTRDREEARRILAEVTQKLNEFQGLFSSRLA